MTEAPFPLVEGRTAFKGQPVPFTQLWIDGRPDFTTVDPLKLRLCARKGLCAICSRGLNPTNVYFAGGHRSNTFIDGPMHKACAEYAMAVCPYLAKGKERPLERQAESNIGVAEDSPIRVLFHARGYTHDGHYFFPRGLRIVEREP